MDTDNIVPDEETILNNIKNMHKGNWDNVMKYYGEVIKCKRYYYSVCDKAAFNGHLEVLKYAHENGCHWNRWVCTKAAEKGHLDILYYLYENEAPYGIFNCIHPNCKEFFDSFGEYWEKGDFSLMHNLKPAKSKTKI